MRTINDNVTFDEMLLMVLSIDKMNKDKGK